MQIYEKENSHLFCGYWNGSPVEIGEGFLTAAPESEVRHKHAYHEYYVVLEGEAQLEVNERVILIRAGMVIMVEPGEWHQIVCLRSRCQMGDHQGAFRTKFEDCGEA